MLGVMTPADAPDPTSVLTAFGLPGSPVSLVEVDGAWSNRVFRLTTSTGVYAVKELRNHWGEPRWLDWLAESWRLELAVVAAGVGVPSPVAPVASSGCVAFADRADLSSQVPVRVHHWVTGSRPGPGAVDREVAASVGMTLATVHGLALRPLDPSLFPVAAASTAESWPELVERAGSTGVDWAGQMRSALPWVHRAAALLGPDGLGEDRSRAVMCHGDLDKRNLLLTDAGPVVCDWDVAMPAEPEHDLADVALSLASWRDRDVARAVVRAYCDAGGSVRSLRPTDLGPSLMVRLDFISHCVRRALGAPGVLAGLSSEAAERVPVLLAELEVRVVLAESVGDWLS